jgi:DNA repair protein RecO (recombination protein O)
MMPLFSSPGILLRRLDYGEQDVILDLFLQRRGKLSVIAKHARRSTRRFAGVLELFSIVEATVSEGRGRGLPVLQEAALQHPLAGIRTDWAKTAYASYWAELVNAWLEPEVVQAETYRLLQHVLQGLDSGAAPAAVLSILFQLRFMHLAGFGPDLRACQACRCEIRSGAAAAPRFDPQRGGVLCDACGTGPNAARPISMGTLMLLRWIEKGELDRLGRLRFTPQAISEGLALLEAFVPLHLGREPRSLGVLRQLRGPGAPASRRQRGGA